MNCTVYTTHIAGLTHMDGHYSIYIDLYIDVLYYCTQLVQMNCTYVYVHN